MPSLHTATSTTTTNCICGCNRAATTTIRGDQFARASCRQRFYRVTVRAARSGDASALATLTTRGWNINANLGGGRGTLRARFTARAVQAATSRVQRFGVEIEFNGCSADAVVRAASALEGILICAESYNHSTRAHWKIVNDGSCGLELVSPVLSGENGFEQVKLACRALRAAGARVDARCGLHVHLEVADLDATTIKRVVGSYAANQPVINSILARSRHTNTYARSYDASELSRINAASTVQQMASATSCRYKTVNLQSFPRYGTIEFRQHQGTHNAEKITRWVRFAMAMVETARRSEIARTSTLAELMRTLGLSNDDQAFFTERAMELA